MPAPDVLVIGDANPDLLLTGAVPEFGQAETLVDSAELVLGGSAAIVACGLARLGVATALAATVGDDLYGGFVRDALTERGVDVRWLRTDLRLRPASVSCSRSTTARSSPIRGRSPRPAPRSSTRTCSPRSRTSTAPRYYLQPRLAPYLPQVLGRARDGGATTSVDTNFDPARTWLGSVPLLEQAHVLMPNATELRALTGESDLDAAARVVLGAGLPRGSQARRRRRCPLGGSRRGTPRPHPGRDGGRHHRCRRLVRRGLHQWHGRAAPG